MTRAYRPGDATTDDKRIDRSNSAVTA